MTYDVEILEVFEDVGCATTPEVGRALEGRGVHVCASNLSRILQSMERFGYVTNLGMAITGPGNPSARWRLTA